MSVVVPKIKKIILASPRGFCAGVNRAIDIVNLCLEKYGAPLYVRHEIVHNHHVVSDFKSRGVIFIEQLTEVPDDSFVIFSAHGTDPHVLKQAQDRGLKFIDAVCPLVTKVHKQIERSLSEFRKVLYIGHKGHQEVVGSMGYAPEDIYLVETLADIDRLAPILENQKLMVCTQTTLSIDDTAAIIAKLKEVFTANIDGQPQLELPRSDDICYATQNRQDAVKELVKQCDHILIIGSENSSNTLRLLELAIKSGLSAELVPNPAEYEATVDLSNKVIGISSGASAPESLVETLVSKLSGADTQLEILKFKEETIVFPLPKEV